MAKELTSIVVIGAGPAGLAAAWQLASEGSRPLVLEKEGKVGGIARTEIHRGYRFDIGGHRFFTKSERLNRLWREMLGEDFIRVRRLSRIYYQGRFFDYPLDPLNALANLGPAESLRVATSFLKAKLRPSAREDTLEEWVVNRFGERLYRIFFKGYTEKVWGITCDRIHADWAAQRIRGLSLWKAVADSLFGGQDAKTLTREFHYPRLGPGMMWERFREEVERRGGKVLLNAPVIRVRHEGGRVTSVFHRNGAAGCEVPTAYLISSMPLPELVRALDPPAPPEVAAAAAGLAYRSFVLAGLIVGRAALFPDQWIYVNNPELRVGRVQNPGNWSAAMVPVPGTSSVGMEYFCTEGDGTWTMPDADFIALASRELEALGLARREQVEDGAVFRQPRAYPVYDEGYRERLGAIRGFLSRLENLQSVGRGGMHRYNNMDHSMLTALLAVENMRGASHDLWGVNREEDYLEEGDAAGL